MTRAVLANKQTMGVGEQIWQVTEKESYQEEEDQGVIMRRRMAEVWRLGELTVDRCLALPSTHSLPCLAAQKWSEELNKCFWSVMVTPLCLALDRFGLFIQVKVVT